MPSKSRKQQELFVLALQIKQNPGMRRPSGLSSVTFKKARKIAGGTSLSKITEFAETSTKGLPSRIKKERR